MEYEEKELETFPSTYMKDFIWFKNVEKSAINLPVDTFALPEEEKNEYIRQVKFKLRPQDFESIKNLYANRMQTTYKVSYCKEKEKEKKENDEEFEEDTDTMMNEARKLYSERTKKLLPPLSTSRRVFGYCRPAFYYTELSEYQGTYGHLGYNILKRYEETGVARTAPRYDCKTILKPGETQ